MLRWTTVSLSVLCPDYHFRTTTLHLTCTFFHVPVNLLKVCNYIQQRSRSDCQCIVISLKDMFYERSDSLVGICKDVKSNSSRTVTLDLRQYDKKEDKKKSKKRSRRAASEGGTPSKRAALEASPAPTITTQ